jgi:hypothetical protein
MQGETGVHLLPGVTILTDCRIALMAGVWRL